MSVINKTLTPLLYSLIALRDGRSVGYTTINQILTIQEAGGVDRRTEVLNEIATVCRGRFWGCAVFGDPMGDPGVTFVGVKALTWQEAQCQVQDHPEFGLHAPWAMWGCGGFYRSKGNQYFFGFKEGSGQPENLYLKAMSEPNGDYHVKLWEDMLEEELRGKDKCTCLHLRWQHAVKQCREKDCYCTLGYDNIDVLP